MKILLLGYKGMLGSDLMQKLCLEHEVIGMDQEEIDITSFDQTSKTVYETAPDVVINAAAYTNVDGCETARDISFAVNAEAVKISPWRARIKKSELFTLVQIMFLTVCRTLLIQKKINAIP